MDPLKCPFPNEAKTARFEDFTATNWTQVLLASRQDGSVASGQALEQLCTRYWPSIYSFLRRKGFLPADAEDLTQGFFADLLEENSIARADRSKGRFRTFLLGALQRYLVDEHRHSRAKKRGGNLVVLALDFSAVEECYLEELDPALTPEETFDRHWAATLLEHALAGLHNEFRNAGQSERFAELKRFLSDEGSDREYATIAKRLDITPKAVSSAVSRFRQRYRELVRQMVMESVASPGDVDPEFRELFS